MSPVQEPVASLVRSPWRALAQPSLLGAPIWMMFEHFTLVFPWNPVILLLSFQGFFFPYLTFVFMCFFPSPKNPHRCLAVTSLWMTNILSLDLGTRRPRFMKLFIKDKSSCELDSFSLQHFVLSVPLQPPTPRLKLRIRPSLQLGCQTPTLAPTSSLLSIVKTH